MDIDFKPFSMPPSVDRPVNGRCRIVISVNMAWNLFNFRRGLIRALINSGCEVITVAPPDECVAGLKALGCRYVPIRMDNQGTNPLADLQLIREYVRVFSELEPDLVCFYTVKPNIYGSLAARLLGLPVVNTISGLGTPFIEGGAVAEVVKRLYRVALSRSKYVFFQNSDDLDFFLANRLVREEQTRTVPGSGVDLQHFRDTAHFDARPQPRPDGPAAINFLLIARLLYDKGVREYVDAARMVRRNYPAAKFTLLGFLDAENPTAVPREHVEQWVAEGLVEYVDPVADVRPQIAKADCVVLPSYREGTPKTLLEAAAMGKPIITTDVAGCREVVTDGENGLLCRVKDAEDLAAKISTLIEMPEHRRIAMGKAGRRKTVQEFDERIVINRYLTAVNEIVASNGAGRGASSEDCAVASPL